MQAKTKILLIPVFVFIIFLLLGIVVAPTLGSTYLGQRSLVKIINRKLDGKAEIQKISLSWLGHQRIGDITIRNKNQDVILHLDQIVIEDNLASLFWNNIWHANGTISGLSIRHPILLAQDGQGSFAFNGKSDLKADLEANFLNQQPFELQINGSLSESSNKQGIINLNLRSTAGHMTGSFAVDDAIQLHNNTPLHFSWNVDPRLTTTGKLNLPSMQTDTLEVLKPFKLEGTLSDLNFPLNTQDSTNATFAMELVVDELHLKSKEHDQEIYLKAIQLHANKKPQAEGFDFSIAALAGDEILHGDINIAGSVNDFLSSDSTVKLKAIARDLPIPIIASLMPIDKKFPKQLSTLLGKKIDINASLFLHQMDGPLQIQVTGERGNFFIDGTLLDGILRLESPLRLVTTVSEDFGKEITQPLIPIFSGIVSADNPLELTIDPEGFSLPISELKLETITIAKMKINLGVLYFSNQGELAKMLRPFKVKIDEPITLWFTPIYAALQNGIAIIKRTDVLVNKRYPTALWGKINLLEETLNMQVGLSTAALNRALSISLPTQDTITVLPLEGKKGKISIDTSGLKLQIGSALAKFLAPSLTEGASQLLEEAKARPETHIPPATTNPQPWDNGTINAIQTPLDERRKERKQSQTQLQRKGRALLKMLQG